MGSRNTGVGTPGCVASTETHSAQAGSTRLWAVVLVVVLLLLTGAGGTWSLLTADQRTTAHQDLKGPVTVDGDLSVGGQLQMAGSALLPLRAPARATAGNIYYDSHTNQPYYYNGSKFVAMGAQTGVASLGGQDGIIGLGGGLELQGGQLQVTASLLHLASQVIPAPAKQQISGMHLLVSESGGDYVIALPQALDSTATPTFAGLNLSGALAVGSGGTGASTAAGARTSLGAAAGGTNSDIISTTALNTITPNGAFGLGAVNQTFTLQGAAASSIAVTNGANTTSLTFASPTASTSLVLPALGAGSYDICTSFGNCPSSGVLSLNGIAGNITLGDASVAGQTITINDASTTAKGIASFNSGNFSVVAGAVNTIQDIGVGATPTFGGLTLSSALTIGSGGTGATTAASARSNLGAAASGANGDITSTTALNTITPSGAFTLGATAQNFLLQGAAGSSITATSGANTSTLSFAAPTGTRGIVLPDASGTVCLQSAAACGFAASSGSGGYIQNQNAGQQATSNYWVSGTGQTDGGLLAPSLDTASAGALSLGATNATAINLNQNTSLAAGKSLTITGGATGTRPASPAEGMVYYDTTTKQLLVYANGKWQADRSTSTKIVAMGQASGCSGSVPIASANFDSADFVSTSCTSAQTTINAAITALPASGGSIYLMDGTYIIDGAISVPSSVTIAGAGASTVIKLKDGINANFDAIVNADTAAGNDLIMLTNFKLDGNLANNSSGTQVGVTFNKAGSSATAGGATITQLWVQNFRDYCIDLSARGLGASYNDTVTNNHISNCKYGIAASRYTTVGNNSISNISQNAVLLPLSISVTVSDNQIYSATKGVTLVSAKRSSISGNIIDCNNTASSIGVEFNSNNVSFNTITANSISNCADNGIYLSWIDTSDTNNVVSSNSFYNNGGSGANSTIAIGLSTGTQLIGNTITDTVGTGAAISIAANTQGAYLSGNRYSGTGATTISDLGNGTIYADQLNSSGAMVLSGAAGFGINTSSPLTSLQNAGAFLQGGLGAPAAAAVTTAGTAGTTTYGYRVTAYDGIGETLASTETTITTGNATLTGSNYNVIAPSGVPGALSYKVYRTTSGGTPSSTGLIGTLGASTTPLQLNDTGLAASGATPTVNTTGQMQVLGASAVFKNSADSAAAVVIQNAAGSSLFTADTTNGRIVVNASITQMAAPGSLSMGTASGGSLAASTTYYYKVTAVDSMGGETTTSPENSITTTASNRTITISWAAVNGAVAYRVYRGSATGLEAGFYSTSATSFSDTGATMDNSHTAPPTASAAIVSTSTGGTSLNQVAIGGIGKITGQLYVSGVIVSKGDISKLATPAAPTITPQGTPGSSTLYYEIEAVNAQGQASSPSGFGQTNTSVAYNLLNGTNFNRLTWSAVPGAVSYNVYRMVGGIPAPSGLLANVSAVTYDDTGTSPLSVSAPTDAIGSAQVLLGGFHSVDIQGSFAYVGMSANSSILVFDISNPVAPTYKTSVSTPASTSDLDIQGNYLYAASYNNTLSAISINNPGSPSTVKTIGTQGTAQQVVASGNYLYTVNNNNTLQVFSIADPTNPVLISSTATATAPAGLVVKGRYAYIVNNTSSTLQIFDVANPASPSSVASIATTSNPTTLTIAGNYAYVLGSSGVIQVINISNVTAPSVISTTSTGTRVPIDIKVQGRFAYVPLSGGSNHAKLATYDISNPAGPVQLGMVTTDGLPSGYYGSPGCYNDQALVVSGRYVYYAGCARMSVFDAGGAYIQQLETGGLRVGTLDAVSDATFAADVSIQGGVGIGGNLQATGGLGVAGSTVLQGSLAVGGTVVGGLSVGSITSPTSPTVVTVGTAGSTSYSYTVTAVAANGSETTAPTATVIATGNASLTTSNFNRISWAQVSGAASYKVYRTASAGSPSSTGFLVSTSGTSLDDTALAGSGSLPTLNATGNLSVTGGNALFKSATDNAAAFSVQNAAGVSVLSADTANRRIQINGTNTVMATPGALTLATASGGSLAASTTYYYRITALDAAGGETLASPENSIATTAGNRTINVSWTAITGAVGYRVYRSTSTGTETLRNVTEGASYSDSGATATDFAGIPRSVPAVANAYVVSSVSNANLQLTVGSGTPSGQLYVGGSALAQPSTNGLAVPGTPTVTQQGTAGTTFASYAVTAINASGETYGSRAGLTGTSNVTLSGTNFNRITWSAVSGATSYNVYRLNFNNSGLSTGLIGSTASTSFDDTGAVTSPTVNMPTPSVSQFKFPYYPKSVEVVNNVMYVGNFSSTSLDIYDVTSPRNPQYRTSITVTPSVRVIKAVGRYLYVAGASAGSTSILLQIFDIKNPLSPVAVGTTTLATTLSAYGGNIDDIQVSGKYVFVTAATTSTSSQRLIAVDISNITSPTMVSLVQVDACSNGVNTTIKGNLLYVYTGCNRLKIFDISNPSNPVELGSVSLDVSLSTMIVAGGYLYGCGSPSGSSPAFRVIDVRNPNAPALVGSVPLQTPGTGGVAGDQSLVIAGGIVYQADQEASAVRAIDVSNPAAPTVLGSVTLSTVPYMLVMNGRYVYAVGRSTSSLTSNPAFVFDTGGAFMQNLQAGAGRFDSVQIDTSATVNGDASIQGSLRTGASLQTDGDLGVVGSSYFQGSVVMGSGILGGTSVGSLSTPVTPTIATRGTAGSTSYSYTVTAVSTTGGETLAPTAATIAIGNATLSAANFNFISWASVPGAASYNVYRTASGGTPASTGLIGNTRSLSFGDTGLAGSGSAPTVNTTGTLTVANYLGVNNANPQNRLAINSLTTADAAGQLVVSTAGTGNKAVVLQGVASQTANIFEIQNSTGTVLASIGAGGELTVTTATFNGNIVVNGHIISGGTAPTTTAGAAACTTPTVSVAGKDAAGLITVTTGTACGAGGVMATLNFNAAYGAAPRVVVTPAEANAAGLHGFVDSATITTGAFDLKTLATDVITDTTTYKWYYHVIE